MTFFNRLTGVLNMKAVHRAVIFRWAILLAIFVLPLNLCADGGTVSFKQGGTLSGTVVDSNSQKETASETVIRFPEGGSIVVSPDIIRQKTERDASQTWYWQTAPSIPDTIESHLDFADQCRRKKLEEESKRHYQRVLELDPENEKAHIALKHVKDKDGWQSRTKAEQLQLKGYVTYSGKTLTSQEVELEKKRLAAKEKNRELKKQIKSITAGLLANRPDAKAELRRIKDPAALGPLSEEYNERNIVGLRILFIQAYGNIGTPAALMELAVISQADNNEEIRRAALEQIKRKPQAIPGAVEYYKRFLLSADNLQVNRAGFALGFLERREAIPFLIDALITEHKETVIVGSDKTGGTFGSDGSMKGMSFGSGTKKKEFTRQYNNELVLEGLRHVVAANYNPAVDFRFEVDAWKNWYRQQERTWRFNARRDP